MVDKNKILYLDNVFTKALPTSEESIDSIYIEGYASTADVDRHGDVIPPSVWEAGLENYLKNPVILAYHDHDDPCGRMVEHKVDVNGLWIKARISAAAEVFNLVKDGVVTAFSVGFRIKDAEYNSAAEVFMVTELELHEISVVAVPANQNTLFNLSKSFETDEEYKSFKSQFAPKSESAKGLESITEAESTNIIKEFGMNQEEIKQMLADAAKQAADQATKAIAEKQAQAEAEKAAAAKAEADLDARIKAAVASVSVGESGAEKLLAEVEKRFAEQSESTKSVIAGLESALKEKAAEIEAIQKSKMQFSGDKGDMSYADKEKAVMLSKMSGKSLDGTKFGRDMVQKYGAHLPSATWELEVSLNMENEVRRRLVVAPTLRNVSMQTNVMTLPVNPEAGVATWMANSAFGTAASAGATQNHALKEITLNSYKVSTNEYMAFEEEEDSLIVLMPIVRDAMVRRVARAVDRAFLMGAGTGADPVKGLATYDAVADVSPSAASGVVTIANLRAMRKGLGAWGLDPAEMVYVVSTEVYYDLLEDATFQTMDKVGTQATLLTGQVGSIANTPVLVSAEFASKASGAVGAIAYAPGNFLVGNQRGLRVDTQELVETQRRVMVASLRTGMTQVTTNLGAGVSKLVYAA